MSLLSLAFLPAAAALMLWALLDLERFVLFGILGTIMFPNAILTPDGSQVAAADILQIIAVVAWLMRNSLGASPDLRLRENPMLIPAVLFVSINGVSVLWSDAGRDVAFFTLQLFWITVVTPTVFASLPQRIPIIRQAMIVFVAITSAMAVVATVRFIPHAAVGDFDGTSIFGLNKNALGAFLAAGVVSAYVFWLLAPRGLARVGFVVAAIIEAAGLFASVSRGSLLGALVAVVACSFLLRRRRGLTTGIVLLAAIGFGLGIGLQPAAKKDAAGSYDSSVVRVYAWPRAIKKIEQRPFLGTGATTYRDYLPEIHVGIADANNMFLQTAAEVGLIGLALLLLLLYQFGRVFVASARFPPDARAVAVVAGGVGISVFVHNQVDITWIRGQTSIAFVMMGLIVAIRSQVVQRGSEFSDARQP